MNAVSVSKEGIVSPHRNSNSLWWKYPEVLFYAGIWWFLSTEKWQDFVVISLQSLHNWAVSFSRAPAWKRPRGSFSSIDNADHGVLKGKTGSQKCGQNYPRQQNNERISCSWMMLKQNIFFSSKQLMLYARKKIRTCPIKKNYLHMRQEYKIFSD